MTDSVGEWVGSVLGEHAVDRELTVNGRKGATGQQVRLVRGHDGRRWVLKQVRAAQEWYAETAAYERWAGVLPDRGPTLLASHEGHQSLLLSQVPGRHPSRPGRDVHRRAGRLLRALHDAVPERAEPAGHRDHALERVDRLVREADGALTLADRALIRERAARLEGLPPIAQVPCRGDFRRHNWLVDDDGTLRVIDFGKARWEAAAWDLTRLFLRPWWDRPGLAAAFLEGYGRGLSRAEADLVEARMVVDALSHVAFGVKQGSRRHVRFGRSRLEALHDGHRVVQIGLLESPRDG